MPPACLLHVAALQWAVLVHFVLMNRSTIAASVLKLTSNNAPNLQLYWLVVLTSLTNSLILKRIKK